MFYIFSKFLYHERKKLRQWSSTQVTVKYMTESITKAFPELKKY